LSISAPACDGDLPRRLAAEVMVKKTTGRNSAVEGRESKILQGSSRSLGSKFERHRYCGGPSAALSRLGEASSGQTPIFAPQREGRSQQKTKEPHPRSNSNLFPPSALLPFSYQPNNKNTANMLIYKVRLPPVQKSCCNSSSRLSICSSSNRCASFGQLNHSLNPGAPS
jgi:hypothetical protein